MDEDMTECDGLGYLILLDSNDSNRLTATWVANNQTDHIAWMEIPKLTLYLEPSTFPMLLSDGALSQLEDDLYFCKSLSEDVVGNLLAK